MGSCGREMDMRYSTEDIVNGEKEDRQGGRDRKKERKRNRKMRESELTDVRGTMRAQIKV